MAVRILADRDWSFFIPEGEHGYIDIEDSTFVRNRTIPSWHNYIPEEIIGRWAELTTQERLIAYLVAKPMADEAYEELQELWEGDDAEYRRDMDNE